MSTSLIVQPQDAELQVFAALFTIGRAEDSDLRLDDEYASPCHAICYPRDDNWVIEDFGSTNGTYINGELRPFHGPRRLERGDRVTVGRTVLVMVPA
jgi:pSer/pThr/pTyr-binding forkhead associated (FHA) protein